MPVIKPCPVCNRMPEITCVPSYGGYVVTIKCKPLFKKTHAEVKGANYRPWQSHDEAIDEWNRMVQLYESERKN